jgi:hypothetical protein
MGMGKFSHPQPDMGIPAVSHCYHVDGSGESIPDGDLPIAILIHAAAPPLSYIMYLFFYSSLYLVIADVFTDIPIPIRTK